MFVNVFNMNNEHGKTFGFSFPLENCICTMAKIWRKRYHFVLCVVVANDADDENLWLQAREKALEWGFVCVCSGNMLRCDISAKYVFTIEISFHEKNFFPVRFCFLFVSHFLVRWHYTMHWKRSILFQCAYARARGIIRVVMLCILYFSHPLQESTCKRNCCSTVLDLYVLWW